jgi:hypothetical protein
MGVHPVAVDLTLTQARKLDYINGTVKNKVHRMQIQTYTVTRSTNVTRTYTHTHTIIPMH